MCEKTIQKKIERLANCRDDYELTSCKRNICEKAMSCNGKCSHCRIESVYNELFQIIPERVYEN